MNATEFLREYFRGTQGDVYLTALRNADSKLEKGEVNRLISREPKAVETFIAESDLKEFENGIYFTTATLKPGTNRRIKENCLQFVSLFADVDDKNHELGRDMALALLENTESPPTIIVDSGHGLQPYWMLAETSEDYDRIENVRKKLHALTASDPVHDAPRVMRLPGTHNRNGEWIGAKVVSYRPEYRYSLETLQDWIDRSAVIVPRKTEQPKPQHTNGHANGKSHPFHDDIDADRVCAALEYIPADSRDIWLKIGMALEAGLGNQGRAIWDDWSAGCADKFDTRDQDRVWRSFKGSGIGIGTLFEYAKQHGWDSRYRKNAHANGFDAAPQQQSKQSAEPETLESVRASCVKMKAVEWLWPNRFAIGKLGIIAGLPDEGKGQILCDIAARITSRDNKWWPCGEGVAPDGNIILLTAEDDPGDTVVPRLAAAGADLDKVEIVSMVRREKGGRRMFNLVTDLELLRQPDAVPGKRAAGQIF